MLCLHCQSVWLSICNLSVTEAKYTYLLRFTDIDENFLSLVRLRFEAKSWVRVQACYNYHSQ